MRGTNKTGISAVVAFTSCIWTFGGSDPSHRTVMSYALPGDAYMGVAPIVCKHSRIRSAKHHAGHASTFVVIHAIHQQHLTRTNRWGDAYIECSALRFLIDATAAVSVGTVAHTSSNSTSLSLESESTRLLTCRLVACGRDADVLWTLATCRRT